MQPIATLALIRNATQRTGSTPRDRGDYLAMTEWNPFAKLFEVRRCVLPEAVRDRRHRLSSLEQLFDNLAGINSRGVGQMQIDHGGP
jgi:hypothetical protein